MRVSVITLVEPDNRFQRDCKVYKGDVGKYQTRVQMVIFIFFIIKLRLIELVWRIGANRLVLKMQCRPIWHSRQAQSNA